MIRSDARWMFVLLSALLAGVASSRAADPAKAAAKEIDGKSAAQWIKHLTHQDSEERDLAVEKLVEFEDPPIAAILSAWPETQFSTKLLDETTEEADLLDGLNDVVTEFDVDALPGLIQGLEDKEDKVRGAAAYFLGMLALPGEAQWNSVKPLKKLLGDKCHYVREMSAWALGQIGGTDAEECKADLKKLAEQDPDTLVRVAAATALANIDASLRDEGAKAPPLDPLILKALANDDEHVRSGAAAYVANLGPDAKEALPELEKLFKDKNALVRIDAAAAYWLISSEAKKPLPVLKELLAAKEMVVRERAAFVVGNIGDKSLMPVLRKMAEEDPLRRVRSAARISAEELRDAEAPAAAPET
jgi:HEAT repeat protein